MIAADFDIRDCLVSAVLLPDLEANRRMLRDQGSQLFQATMDVDLDECGGLPG
jgi:Mg2+/Co2+ transporter CorC